MIGLVDVFAIRSGFIACCIILSACGGGSSSGSDNSSAPADNSELTIIGETEVAAQSTQILLAQDNSDSAITAPWQWTVVSGQSLLETAEVDEERFQYRSVALNGPASIRVRVQRQAADEEHRSAETSIQLRPANDTVMAPRVDAGSDKVADEGEEITLYSSVTARNGRSIRALSWQQTAGPSATIIGASDQDSLHLRLPQVEHDDTLRFRLSARDSGGFIGSDNTSVQLRNVFQNRLPIVDVGDSFDARGRERVSLRASAIDPDGDIVSVRWQGLGEDNDVVIDGADTLQASFVAPNPSEARDLVLRLTATDNSGGSASADLRIHLLPVANRAPQIERVEVDPGVAYSGETVFLRGIASDADGDALQTIWQQGETSGDVRLGLRDADKPNASFIVPALSEPVLVEIAWQVSDGRAHTEERRSLQLVPREAQSPDPLSCLMDPLQPGCPLYPLSSILDPQAFLACSDPLSSDCILGDLIGPSLRQCLRQPSAEGCAEALLDVTEPSYVLEQIGPEAPADACTPAYDPDSFEDYIGAMHEHTAYSDGTPLTKPADVYRRVKELGYDFVASSDHSDNLGIPLSTGIGRAECPPENFLYCLFLVDEQRPQDALAKWAATLSQSNAATTDNFTAIRGFEWTSDRFGHANVYFSRNIINAKTGPGYAVSMALFWQWFTYPAQFGGGSDGLLSFNHPGREDALESVFEFAGGDPAFTFNDFRYVDTADYRVVGIEVFGKGSEYDSDGPGGSWLSYALDKGWHLAPISSEDHHGIHWGDPDLPKTVIRARSRSLDDFREALLARRIYAVAQHYSDLRLDYRVADATLGARIRQPAGSVLPYRVSVSLHGQVMSSAVVQLVGPGNTVLAEATGGELQGELSVGSNKKYAFVRVLDSENNNRPVAFSAPIWLLPGDAPLPLCRPPSVWEGDSLLYPELP